MMVRQAQPSVDFLTGVLGWRVVGTSANRTRVAAGADAPGHLIDVIEDNNARTAVNGLGTVHHVAMAIATAEEQLEVREQLVKLGVGVTDVRDRCYFTSIYFREPGGVLFEIATMKPGFTIDEPDRITRQGPEAAALGRAASRVDRSRTLPASPTASGPHAGQPVLNAGKPLGEAPVVVILVHGRGAGPENILDLVPSIGRANVTFLAPAASNRTWYPYSFISDIAKNEPHLSSALSVLASLVASSRRPASPATTSSLAASRRGRASRPSSRFATPRDSAASWRSAAAPSGRPGRHGTNQADSTAHRSSSGAVTSTAYSRTAGP